MQAWYMLTLIGQDQAGIVAKVTHTLYQAGCELGETSMMRLGGNFTMMMMVKTALMRDTLQDLLLPLRAELRLHLHVDTIQGELHQHHVPDVRISVHGADRAGIVAEVTGALAEAGCNIVDLTSDVGGSAAKPFYILHIEGIAGAGLDAVAAAVDALNRRHGDALKLQLTPLDPVIL